MNKAKQLIDEEIGIIRDRMKDFEDHCPERAECEKILGRLYDISDKLEEVTAPELNVAKDAESLKINIGMQIEFLLHSGKYVDETIDKIYKFASKYASQLSLQLGGYTYDQMRARIMDCALHFGFHHPLKDDSTSLSVINDWITEHIGLPKEGYSKEKIKSAMCRLLHKALRDKSLGGMSTYYPYVNGLFDELLPSLQKDKEQVICGDKCPKCDSDNLIDVDDHYTKCNNCNFQFVGA